ncbi:Vacuolar protein-sorting-associated protein 36 [Stylosanthes scabra]|uniref:Vacuolar protein-sorting-associated protein 36 n=1 Tax=Stylosanthes scabra TaxID=79078 RepID=A0ABU6YVB4_9FABA|nr:Vacuolar protein-sorting-associated protein 36 [Stylosanthes scabra]
MAIFRFCSHNRNIDIISRAVDVSLGSKNLKCDASISYEHGIDLSNREAGVNKSKDKMHIITYPHGMPFAQVALADFVKVPLERAGGIVNLIDIYCLFNRARGTELISPDDLLKACLLWEKFDVPMVLRKFDSGVKVIQNKSHSDEEVFSKIKVLVTKPEALRAGISASDAARTLGVAPAMAKEHLLSAESTGLLCRDTSLDGIRFYINLFTEIDQDDMHLVKDHGVYASWIRVNHAP